MMTRAWRSFVAASLVCASARAGDVVIAVRGGAGADLQLRDPSGWTTLCRTPCKTSGPADGLYRITGEGIVPSREIRLPTSDVIVLDAHPTTFAMHRNQTSLMIGGIVVASVGLATLATGAFWAMYLQQANDCIFFLACARSYDTTGPNVAILVGGLVALVGGVLAGSGAEGRHASRLVPFGMRF